MTFWGVEVRPGEPFILDSDELGGSLILTQATLGLGSSNKRSVLQVTVGDNKPIFLCSLLPGKSESFTLNLEFAEEEEVKFSIVGKTSIHISGYVQRPQEDDDDDIDDDVHECGDMDCCAEDVDESESEDSESKFEDDFIVDPSSTVKNKGVVIEEIDDEEKPVSEKAEKKKKKKDQQIVVKGETSALELESEDEDGFPVSVTGNGESRFAKLQANSESKVSDKEKKNKTNIVKEDSESASNSKRKSDDADLDQEPKSDAIDGDTSVDNTKKKNKKNKRKAQVEKDETVSNTEQNTGEVANVKKDGEKKEKKTPTSVKPAKARTYSNGLVVEEMEMGKPNGKRASPGKTVSVRYIGKLKKNDKVFDSNTSGKPFEFRLGIGQVIKGWDVGVEGMRIGDKRRLTIPPSMGYGASGAPPSIPPNAWLVFDVELVNVN